MEILGNANQIYVKMKIICFRDDDKKYLNCLFLQAIMWEAENKRNLIIAKISINYHDIAKTTVYMTHIYIYI